MLKESLGFKGLVLSDDIGMGAISARYGTVEATVAAIAAGCDAVLMCGDAIRTFNPGRSKRWSTRSKTERCRSSESRTRWRATGG